MEVSEWRGELRVDIREWRDDKPTKKGISLTLMRWKNWVNELEFAEKVYMKRSHMAITSEEICTVLSPKMACGGHKTILETSGRGDTHQKGDMFKTIRIRSLERTVI